MGVKQTEALKLAQERLELWFDERGIAADAAALSAIREALAEQPAQPSKPWVGLTNQELIDLTSAHSGAALYCAIEARLKEKNT